MKYITFDMETDGLLENVSKFHCGVIKYSDSGVLNHYTDIETFIQVLVLEVSAGYKLVGHNIIRYDLPVLNKISPISIAEMRLLKSAAIDTLPLSWHLWTERAENNQSFGLESIGEFFGIQKPPIEDWRNLTTAEYINRCSEDVKINEKLIEFLLRRALLLYKEEDFIQYQQYLNFKMECLLHQEHDKIKVDRILVGKTLAEINGQAEIKQKALARIMPPTALYGTTKLPSKVLSNSGVPTAHAIKFGRAFLEKGTKINPKTRVLKFKSGETEPNPNSHAQLKEFLFSLGWEPDVFKTGAMGALIPQISDEDKEITKSVKKLYAKEPELKNLEGLYMLRHRSAILEGFLEKSKETGRIEPTARGFTSTLRLKHLNVVNLPSVKKPYGEEIRGSLTTDGINKIFIGCDMVALEDATKQHYMYYFDPDYVDTMRQKDFDPHLDLAVLAGFLTKEQADAHKAKTEDHTIQRQRAKRANYACTYGAGAPKLSASLEIPIEDARALHTAYWKRNEAVQKVSRSVKKVTLPDGTMWVQNPVSKFWMPLRSEKDIFSAVNQSTGVYVFDLFIKEVTKAGLWPVMQYHDEILLQVNKWEVDATQQILDACIKKVNDALKLNVPMRIDYKTGKDYAEVH